MNRVVVTRPIVGICHMQVCAAKDATDEEILAICNRENPSGTTNGWGHVVRSAEPDSMFKTPGPVQCDDDPERLHILVAC